MGMRVSEPLVWLAQTLSWLFAQLFYEKARREICRDYETVILQKECCKPLSPSLHCLYVVKEGPLTRSLF